MSLDENSYNRILSPESTILAQNYNPILNTAHSDPFRPLHNIERYYIDKCVHYDAHLKIGQYVEYDIIVTEEFDDWLESESITTHRQTLR